MDRYLLITRNVRYTHSTTLPRRKVCIMMAASAWILSALIASLPLLGWRTGTERNDPTDCVISQDYGYTIFSTFGAFWFPLSLILVIYARIFWFARTRAKRLEATQSRCPAVAGTGIGGTTAGSGEVSYNETTTGLQLTACPPPRSRSRGLSPARQYSNSPSPCESTMGLDQMTANKSSPTCAVSTAASRMRKNRVRRMRRSARTLGLIIGGFVVCWLPFFVVATVEPFCAQCRVPPTVASVVLWLGYSNSLFNPIIYAIWDKSFRHSFKRISTCHLR